MSLVPDRTDTNRTGPPNAVLADVLWICGYAIDPEWLRRERIDLVVDVADPDLRLEPEQLGSVGYRKHPLVDGPRFPPRT